MFRRMDDDDDELVTFDQFATVYIQQEEILHHQIASDRDRMIQIHNEIDACKYRLEEEEKTQHHHTNSRRV